MLLKSLERGGYVVQHLHVGRREVVEGGGVVFVDICELLYAFSVSLFDVIVLLYVFCIATKTRLGGGSFRLVPWVESV